MDFHSPLTMKENNFTNKKLSLLPTQEFFLFEEMNREKDGQKKNTTETIMGREVGDS